MIESSLIVGISVLIILLIAIIVLSLYLSTPRTRVVRLRKASLAPLHGGYKARQDGGGLSVHPNPPKAPKGSGGGSH